jgi:hypothetical protein
MKREQISIATADGSEQVIGYVSNAFPGIAIHRHAQFSDRWAAAHIQSGLSISSMFRLRRLASCFAALASRLVDFTKSGDEVQDAVASKHEIRVQLRQLAERFNSK